MGRLPTQRCSHAHSLLPACAGRGTRQLRTADGCTTFHRAGTVDVCGYGRGVLESEAADLGRVPRTHVRLTRRSRTAQDIRKGSAACLLLDCCKRPWTRAPKPMAGLPLVLRMMPPGPRSPAGRLDEPVARRPGRGPVELVDAAAHDEVAAAGTALTHLGPGDCVTVSTTT